MRPLERMLFTCPELNGTDDLGIPPTSEDFFQMMATGFAMNMDAIHIFPFINRTLAGKAYVEVYIWDYMLFPEKYKRFIIFPGFAMSEDDESMFLGYTHWAYYCENGGTGDIFYNEIQDTFPEWHFRAEDGGGIGSVLEHLYFASHRSGPKEILYKADLNRIAAHLIRIPDYNLIGTTPESIIGHDLPLRLLRILNQNEEMVSRLFDEESISLCRNAYDKYGGYIGKELPSAGQWHYLEALCDEKGIFKGERFSRALYNRLAVCGDEVQLSAYKEYLSLRKGLPGLKKRKLPGPEDIIGAVEKLKRIREYRKDNREEAALIRRRGQAKAYNYSADGYSVMIPASAYDICMEAYDQGNCLMDYISPHAEGKTTLLFVRKADAPEQSFVTMEVKDRQITQVYGKHNKLPEKAVFEFLERYAKKAWLYFDPYEIITEALDDLPLDDWDDDLFAYAEDFRRRIRGEVFEWPDDGILYEQMTLEDLFPDVVS